MSVTLTKQQVAVLLPLLPSLGKSHAQSTVDPKDGDSDKNGPTDSDPTEADYPISKMFTKKNGRCTPAQNYLLVSTTDLAT